jgi:hypothetical protein
MPTKAKVAARKRSLCIFRLHVHALTKGYPGRGTIYCNLDRQQLSLQITARYKMMSASSLMRCPFGSLAGSRSAAKRMATRSLRRRVAGTTQKLSVQVRPGPKSDCVHYCPKADKLWCGCFVRQVPKADIAFYSSTSIRFSPKVAHVFGLTSNPLR